MVDRCSSLPTRRRTIPTGKKKARVPAAAPRRPARKAARSSRAAAAPSRTPRRRARRTPSEQPLGAGVGDQFAVARLGVPRDASRARPSRGVREVSWADFGELARALTERIEASYRPEVVLGVVSGGVFLGGALAAPFKAEFHSVRVEKRGGRPVVIDPVGDVRGKAVLAVDDVTVSGDTLRALCAAATRAGARETRTATLVVRPSGNHSDFHALETTEIVVFGWDYQLHGGGGAGDPGEVGV